MECICDRRYGAFEPVKKRQLGEEVIQRDFYERPTLTVARSLLGARLCVRSGGTVISGIIIETEAYIGENDLACHARSGYTKRTSLMYGLPGLAYIYFTYGNHWMFCVVTEGKGIPAAVLIRALVIDHGLELVRERRGQIARRLWTNGPGKLTKAMGIHGGQHGSDITNRENSVWIEEGRMIPDESVTISPRVGLYNVPEPWKSIPWRFLVIQKTNLEELWDY